MFFQTRRSGALLLLLLSSLSALGQAPTRSPKAALPARPEAEERDNPAARQAWFLRGRMVPGKNAAALLHRAFQQKIAIRRAQQQKAAQSAQAAGAGAPSPSLSGGPTTVGQGIGPVWTNIGPAPITGMGIRNGDASGRITSIAVDPNDSTGNTVYVAGAYGGVWKTTNGADSPGSVAWRPLFDTDPAAATLSVGAMAVQPVSAGPVVLVGTGEPNNAIDSYYGQGILRSADGGATWSLISTANSGAISFKGLGFSSIAFSTNNNNLVVAGGAQTPIGIETGAVPNGCPTCGIYYSTDAGLTWHLAATNDPGPTPIQYWRVTDVVYDHGGTTTGPVGKFYAAIAFHGFYSSADGINWTRVSDTGLSGINTTACPSSPTATGPANPCPLYRGNLAVQPNTGELYAVLVSSSTTRTPQVYRATFVSGQVTGWTAITITTGISNCGDGDGCGTGGPATGTPQGQGFYDLYVAAVPNGANTDLYFGAVNLFKCTVTAANSVCGNAGSWLNLTHVYGSCLVSPNTPNLNYRSMHPDQHALEFPLSNPNLVYFGNDGGVYRTLSSTTLNNGVCTSGTGNQFDDLNNSTLGSLTQFIAISTHPTDASITFGGTQDNGSPAIASNLSVNSPLTLNPPLWFEAWGGDGGFNFIDLANTNKWFTANTGVSVQECNSSLDTSPNPPNPVGPGPGTNCIEVDGFQNSVTKAQVGGDQGAFYTPYIVDPANTDPNNTRIVIGTCRVWGGTATVPSTSSSLIALSGNLGQNNSTTAGLPCQGFTSSTGEVDVSALAAGGPASGGLSQVIYAGTDGGAIWVTTNAAGGIGTWSNTTSNAQPPGVNPFHYPISSIAVDSSDLTGRTAYITLMGFTFGAGAHVWKTTNAGGAWTDISGSAGSSPLPDAPVNAVLIDPNNHSIVYVGTDVGVFMTSNVNGASTVWQEWGQSFPNVAVLSLAAAAPLAGSPTTLRAGTHGRGVFETQLASAAAYTLSIADSPKTVYAANLPAVFHGAAATSGIFISPVDLSCIAGSTLAPATCAPSPTPITPTSGAGTALTVSASDAAADYNFKLHGVGQDTNHTLQEASITLHIVDFALGAAPNPISIPHDQPGTVTVTVTAAGTFADTVHLACRAPLPTGISCGFSQNDFVPSNAGTGVTLTIGTTAATALGSTVIHVDVTGSSASAPTKTQDVTVNVTSNPDFLFTAASLAPTQVRVNQVASGSVTLAAQDGFTNAVTLGCSVLPAGPTCSAFTPAAPTPPGGATFTVSEGTGTPQNYVVTVTGTGGGQSHFVDLPYAIWDYALQAPVSANVIPGVTTNVGFTLHPLNGQQNVDVSCRLTNLAGATCSILGGTNPISLAGGDVSLAAALTLPAGPNRCGGGAGCALTLQTVDHDVPAAPARDATINLFPPVTASNDFNADRMADILWQNSSTHDVVVWLMNGAAKTSAAFVATGVDANWKSVGVGDFDGDGKADVLWQNSATGGVVVWLMNGAVKTSAAFVATGVDPNWQIVGVGDFDGDGKTDILWRNTATGGVVVWLMNGASKTSAAFVTTAADPNWQIVGVGDFDGDDNADILWRNTVSGDVVLWRMNGAAKLSGTLVASAVGLNLQVIGVGDLFGDGHADILWRNTVSGDVMLWQMNGTTVVSAATVASAVDPAWQVFGISDFDGDGRADLLWRNSSTGSVVVWLMNGATKTSAAFAATNVDPNWKIVPFTHQ